MAWHKRYLGAALALLVGLFGSTNPARAGRLKDLAALKGVRSNQLIGYGLVVGLSGTGDGNASTFTVQSLASMLSGLGITIDASQIKVRNVAAVMVTAKLPPFAREGSRIDVLVSSTGDARSLVGGTLLMTPLRAPNGDVYAVAQGPLMVGGFAVASSGSSTVKNHLTVARVPGGALVEREVPFSLAGRSELELVLHDPDFTNAVVIESAINDRMAAPIATARDSGTITLKVPDAYRGHIPELMALIEDIEVPVDHVAKVVLNERTGTVIMGDQVRVSRVAVAHGSLTLQIETSPVISQPAPLSRVGATVVVPQSRVSLDDTQDAEADEPPQLKVVDGASIGEIVGALNALGVSPRDLITILQAIRAAGALQAELELI